MKTLKQKGKDIVWVVAGNAVLALAVSMFILPYDIRPAASPALPRRSAAVNSAAGHTDGQYSGGGFVCHRRLLSGKGICYEDHPELADLSGISDLFQRSGSNLGLRSDFSFALRRLIGRHGRRDGVKNRGEYRRKDIPPRSGTIC